MCDQVKSTNDNVLGLHVKVGRVQNQKKENEHCNFIHAVKTTISSLNKKEEEKQKVFNYTVLIEHKYSVGSCKFLTPL